MYKFVNYATIRTLLNNDYGYIFYIKKRNTTVFCPIRILKTFFTIACLLKSIEQIGSVN